jgi:AcrR family transcriptional regulator
MNTIEDPKTDADLTRQRILEAAELVFAEKGREAASVRDILKRAGVRNIAAVNYHFGDKDSLYTAVVKNAHASCCIIAFPDWPAGTPPQVKLHDFIRTMVMRMMVPPRPSALQVMMREVARPTDACREVVREYIQPMAAGLEGILAELFPDLTRPQRFLIGNSIVGQCLFYRQNRPIIEQLMGPEAFQQLTPELLADHITRFTMNGLGLSA